MRRHHQGPEVGMIELPRAPLERVLLRVDAIWHSGGAAHHVIFGQTGSGKTTLMMRLLGLVDDERVLILDPKQHADPAYDDVADAPAAVTTVGPMFGKDQEGGGPSGLWFRLVGAPDRADTARRFAAALAVVEAEGHCALVLDDVREICRQLRLAERVDSILSLGRSANLLAIMCATETGNAAGRQQGGMVWVGHTSGIEAAKAGAGLLGWRGRDRQDQCGAVLPHEWIFSESQPGNAGPCLVTS
jgi:hypothetical protein